MGEEKSLAQQPPLLPRVGSGWVGWAVAQGGGEPLRSCLGLGPVLQGGSEAAWKADGSWDGAAARGVGVWQPVGSEPHPHIVPLLWDHGGCSGGATNPGDKPSPVSPSLGRWSGTMAFPLQTQTQTLSLCNALAPHPKFPGEKGRIRPLPEKIQWWPGCGLWRWATKLGGLPEASPPQEQHGTRRDQEGCHHGPGGMSSWGWEGHGCRTRRDVIAQGQEGSGETRRDIIMGLRGTREDQEGPSLASQEDRGGASIAQGQERHCCVGPVMDITREPEGTSSSQDQEGCGYKRPGGMLLHEAGGTRRDHYQGARRTREGIIAHAQEGHHWRTWRDIIVGPGGTRRTWRAHQGQNFRARRDAVTWHQERHHQRTRRHRDGHCHGMGWDQAGHCHQMGAPEDTAAPGKWQCGL